MFLKRCVILFLLLVSTGLGTDAQTGIKTVVVTSPKRERQFNPNIVGKPEQKLEKAEHKLSDAFKDYDVTGISNLLDDGLEVMGLVSPNAKKSILDMTVNSEKFKNEYRVTSVEKSDLRIEIANHIGIVTGRIYIDYKKENGVGTSTANFMDVWKEDEKGEWKCIAMSTDGQKLIHYPSI